MFTSLKHFINLRLGHSLVSDDAVNDYGYFIKINHRHLFPIVSFLKNDPDLKLTLLDHIIAIPKDCSPLSSQRSAQDQGFSIFYQLNSLKLPYRVGIVVDIDNSDSIPSISSLFAGAQMLEKDIATDLNITFEESLYDQ